MAMKIYTFKADPTDMQRWKEALEMDGRTVSEVCRAALARVAARIEKREQEQ